MYLNKKQLDDILHKTFLLSWGEGRTWYDKRYTDLEMRQLEDRIKSFAIAELKKINRTKGEQNV